MKLALIFDVAFAKYNNQYYSVNLSQKFWEDRYLPYFDEIVVIGREKTVTEDPTGKMVRSDSNKVRFCCMPNGNGINRMFSLNKENKFIEEAIADCDFVVCRSWWGVSVCEKLNKKYMIEVITCAWDGMWNHSRIGRFLAVPYYLNQFRHASSFHANTRNGMAHRFYNGSWQALLKTGQNIHIQRFIPVMYLILRNRTKELYHIIQIIFIYKFFQVRVVSTSGKLISEAIISFAF